MKKITAGSPTILLFLILATTVVSQEHSASYDVPHKLPLEGVVKRTFPEFFRRGNTYPELVPDQFFPIGWSKDGKFAYYVEPVDEACGCYFAHLVIQDMRTDKAVWEFRFSQDEGRDPQTGEMQPENNIQKLWKKNQKLFSDKLEENGIVPSSIALLGATFTAVGRTYAAKAIKKKGKNPEGDKRVDRYTITIDSPKLGSKKLFTSEDHTKDEYWYMLDAGLIGVIKSPWENRVAIIAIDAMRGYEGPPHTGEVRIVGADLTSGFAKK